MKLEVSQRDMHIFIVIVLSLMAVLYFVMAVELFLSGYTMYAVTICAITIFLSIISIAEIHLILSMSESDKEMKE